MLSIARIYYPVTVLGPGKRIGIWVAGCNKNCLGCISPELKNEMNGRKMSTQEIIKVINLIGVIPDGITISGGEPFLHPDSLLSLVMELKKITDDILIFTGFAYEELCKDVFSLKVLENISVLIDGRYIQNLNDGIGLRGSSNQRIMCFRNAEKYNGLENSTRNIQSVFYGDKLLSIGIPKKVENK